MTPFFWSLFKVIINSSDVVIADLSNDLDPELFKVDNNLTFSLLKTKTSIYYIKLIIIIVVLYMICYTHSERFNLLQMANGQLLFAQNVLKQYIKIFNQMSIIVLYKSIWCSLSTNIITMRESL